MKISLTAALKSKTAAAGRYSDGRNLYLNVSKTGAKSWLFIWMPKGTKRQRECGLGSATGAGSTVCLTLDQARAAAAIVRAQIEAGIDPIAAKEIADVTFGALMTKIIENEKPLWKVSPKGVCLQAEEWARTRDKYCLTLKNRQAGSITTNDVLTVIEPMWIATNETAKRVLNRIERTLQMAIARDLLAGKNPARFDDHLEHLLPKVADTSENHAALPYADAPAFMAKLGTYNGLSAKALAFTVLTAVRSANTVGMRWDEVDLDAGLWTIPAERMKVEKRGDVAIAHIVPLSTAALAILESLKGLDADVVFPGKSKGGTIAPGAMLAKLCDPKEKGGMGYADTATVHGMRATFATWVNEETGFAAEEREFALAHVKKADVAAYQRGTSVEKRRPMMQAWANYCEGKADANILQFAARAA